ncbi:response regulator [Paenibacillus sp. IB182496]|uniref:Response regulator n=1 Tax=Paenibacillus sabuli TaxID=2772509 RepID=A0A927GT56_9BACL|nr:response regulator [Paenibacillus sabuli]MBD2846991.1 response regulator [Paenibacillus sabuli]
MIELLLVDDEPMLLQSMIDNDWDAIGIGAVRQASSGQEAAEVLKTHRIDIVVTDIRMPGMSGLELSAHIRDHYPHIRVVLLSGYGEFAYAREAIAYGIVSYLLKPIQDEQLLAEVGRVAAGILKERRHAGDAARAALALRTHLPELRARLLGELLDGTAPAAELEARLQEYELAFRPGAACALVLLRLEQAFREDKPQDEALFGYAVRNMAAELLGSAYAVWPGGGEGGYLPLLLLSPGETPPPLLDLLAELQRQVETLLKGRVSALVQPQTQFPGELPSHYRELRNELRKIPRSARGFVLEGGQPRVLAQPLHALYAPPTLQHLLEGGRWQDAQTRLEELLAALASSEAETEEYLHEVYHALRGALVYAAHLQGKTLQELAGWQAELGEDSPVLRRPELMAEWTAAVLRQAEASAGGETADPRRELIAKIHRFIERNISGDVSLQSIADHVELHPVYLSSLYKQETEENISDYIMRYRMEKAAMLLRSTNTRIYELAGMLGFVNPPYFSKLFKAYYKATPQEYRDRFDER